MISAGGQSPPPDFHKACRFLCRVTFLSLWEQGNSFSVVNGQSQAAAQCKAHSQPCTLPFPAPRPRPLEGPARKQRLDTPSASPARLPVLLLWPCPSGLVIFCRRGPRREGQEDSGLGADWDAHPFFLRFGLSSLQL